MVLRKYRIRTGICYWEIVGPEILYLSPQSVYKHGKIGRSWWIYDGFKVTSRLRKDFQGTAGSFYFLHLSTCM